MKKIQNRTKFCVVLCFLFVAGLMIFIIEYLLNLNTWTLENYYAAIGYNPVQNTEIIRRSNGLRQYYTDDTNSEKLYVRGSIVDANNNFLVSVDENGITYCDDASVRTAMLHATGDKYYMISTGALSSLSNYFSRYTTVGGEYKATDKGNTVQLTMTSDINKVALKAFGKYKGCLGIYNYKTGEIICMVSTPTYDPVNIPSDIATNSAYEGAYINRFISSTFTPGSTMKTVTLEAAIDTVKDLSDKRFSCAGEMTINKQVVHCTGVHGSQTVDVAYANSCNCAFAQISALINRETLMNVVNNGVLTSSITIDGSIETAAGSFDIMDDNDFQFAWTCIGLHHNLMNPCSLMVYIGAVANGGYAAIPTSLKSVTDVNGNVIATTQTNYTGQLIDPDTAEIIRGYMINNTVNHESHFGTWRFKMEIGAKTGTVNRAQGGVNGWFSGFVSDPGHPYAFVCYAENSTSGMNVPGGIVATVLNELIK